MSMDEKSGLRVALLVDGPGAITQTTLPLLDGEIAERIHISELDPLPGEISERVYQLVPSAAALTILEYKLVRVDRAD